MQYEIQTGFIVSLVLTLIVFWWIEIKPKLCKSKQEEKHGN